MSQIARAIRKAMIPLSVGVALHPSLFAQFRVEPVLLHCPENIETQQTLVSKSSIPWDVRLAPWSEQEREASKTVVNSFDTLSFSDGPPSQMFWLVGDDVKSGHRKTSVYRVGSSEGRQLYINCRYTQTAVTLVQALPKPINQCDVTVDVVTQKPTRIACIEAK